MKTDEFSDAIRRKLDSVSPPFQEKKWMQFQAFMNQSGFPPSVWQSPRQWWQPALSAAAVTGLVVMSVWQYQSNQALNRHVQTLTQSVARLEKGQTNLQQSMKQLSQGPTRPDTVYVVQRTDRTGATTLAYSTKPPRTLAASQLANRTHPNVPLVDPFAPNANGPTTTDRFAQTQVEPSRMPVEPSMATARTRNGQPTSNANLAQQAPLVALPPQPGTSRTIMSGQSVGTLSRPTTDQQLATRTNREALRETVAPDVGSAPADTRTAVDQPAVKPGQTRSVNQPTNPTNSVATPAYDNTRYSNSTGTVAQSGKPTRSLTGDNATNSSAGNPATEVATQSAQLAQPERQVASVQLLTPLGMPPVSTEALDASWASHLRRVRYRSPYAPAVVAAVAPDNRPKAAVQWRIGVGGDLTTTQSGGGVNLEVVLANRWTLSAGVGAASWQGDAFQTEAQFTTKTRRPFHSEYPNEVIAPPGPATPRVAIDISRTGQSVLVPLQVGYRIVTTGLLQFTPFVGANLSLNTCESVNFDIDRPIGMGKPRDTDQQQLNITRPLAWYSSWTLGVSAERKWGHLIGQLSPFAALPLTRHEGGLNTASVGLRARIYYQF